MPNTHKPAELEYVASPDQSKATPAHHPVIVVGAGPVGLAAAIDLATRGVATVLLDEDRRVSGGSRAVSYAKRTLEILDRLGCGDAVARRGVSWSHGKVYVRDRQIYGFNLLADEGHRRPPFVNLQQYHLEELLIARAREAKLVDLRWQNRVVGVEAQEDRVALEVETPDGRYALSCDWLVAADGARSMVRGALGLELTTSAAADRFLTADVVMKAEFPSERWFWFDPPFHPNRSVLLHRQPDDVWRIEFQLGPDADPDEERKPDNVGARVRTMLGDDREFEIASVEVYTFRCGRIDAFRHGRVLFAGDAAHQVAPFGARGANSGIQDADNLGWKLALVLAGRAPERLMDSYSEERVAAADENLRASLRTAEFITPGSEASRVFRDAALQLAEQYPFARRIVNSGRLSLPTILGESSLVTPDADRFEGDTVPGAPASDAPITVAGGSAWLLGHFGAGFAGLYFAHRAMSPEEFESLARLAADPIPVRTVVVGRPGEAPPAVPDACRLIEDRTELLTKRYDGRPGTFYLIRPDQHVAARWRALAVPLVREAVALATCND